MEPVTMLTKVMLIRLFAPVIKGGWRKLTNAEEKEAKRRKTEKDADFQQKMEYQRASHKDRLAEAQFSHEKIMEQWATKTYYERCWPLRNPFEMQICKPISDNSDYLDKIIVPCRLISALKDSDHPYARTINGNLSSFVVNYFATNGLHAVVSEIGAWKDDAPNNDASINYLYAGLKKQPVFVLSPSLINDGKTIIFKAWSWGLGEELNYPAGFEFGRLELRPLFQHAIFEESLKIWKLMKELGNSSRNLSPQLQHNLSIIKDLHEKELTISSKERLLSFLKDAPEITENVKAEMEATLSGIFCCVAGMYADAYHLFEYNTAPILPKLLHNLPGVTYMMPSLKAYYYDMLRKMEELDCDKEIIAQTYLDVADSFSKLNFSFERRGMIIEPFVKKALAIHIQSMYPEESEEDLEKLPVIRHIVKSNRKLQQTDIVQSANDIFGRVKMPTLC